MPVVWWKQGGINAVSWVSATENLLFIELSSIAGKLIYVYFEGSWKQTGNPQNRIIRRYSMACQVITDSVDIPAE